MTMFVLFKGLASVQGPIGTAQDGPAVENLPTGSQSHKLTGGAGTPAPAPLAQSFQLVVTAPSPQQTCSATAQPISSNDGINWMAYGDPIVIGNGPSPQSSYVTGNTPFQYYSAILQAISGGGAASCYMVA